MNVFDDVQLDTIADALVERGYVIVDGYLPQSLLHNLVTHFNQLREEEFKAAGVGRQSDFQVQDAIRSDKILWIIPEGSTITTEFLQWMESLRVGINRRLFMGLFDYESHFAHYPAGAFYKKHVDAFRATKAGQVNRVLSTVLYLNETWQSYNGGELVIYAQDGEQALEKVLPEFGRFVIFLSEKFPHEVLPANCSRKSIAGWFRVNEGAV
ncbi:MAG: 2OG-Fe(II) oxygenase [Cellvibrio sp.]